jgi:hypothetical protein
MWYQDFGVAMEGYLIRLARAVWLAMKHVFEGNSVEDVFVSTVYDPPACHIPIGELRVVPRQHQECIEAEEDGDRTMGVHLALAQRTDSFIAILGWASWA